MVTYEQLFDTLRREKSRDELQELEDRFFGHAQHFLQEKKDQLSRQEENTHQAQKAQIEYQNARRILRELYERRERKILTMAMHKTRTDDAVIDTAVLQPEEREFFAETVALLKGHRTNVLNQEPVAAPVEEEKPAEKEQDTDTVQVTFLAEVPKFVGRNLEEYGPYEKGSTENLPNNVAEILVKKGRAEIGKG